MKPAATYERAVASVFHVTSSQGFGTAFLARSDGVALTNHHVVGSDTAVRVQTRQGSTFSASVVSADHDNDLAALLVPPSLYSSITPLPLGEPRTARIGDEVLAIGHPAESAPFSLTRGIVSALTHARSPHASLIQVNISVNWGNSGGPLLSLDGHVVGIVTLLNFTPDRRRIEGVSFAVPSAVAEDFLSLIPDLTKGLGHRRYCPVCGNLVAADRYCSHCGSPEASRAHDHIGMATAPPSPTSGLCLVCDTKNPSGSRYCKTCGIRLGDRGKEE